MDIYAEIDQRRAERAARRQARLEREARSRVIIDNAKCIAELCAFAILLYLYVFFGCLWASM